MIRARPLLRALALLLVAAPVPAMACSISWTRPRDPAVRYAGTDVRRVMGTYRIERIEQARNENDAPRIYGHLTTRRGTGFDVVQPYYEILVECAAYDLPMSDADGLFYLERRARDGRYRILGWQGQPIAGTVLQAAYETGEEGQH